MRVAIFTDEPGWHGNALQKAFAQHHVDALFVSLNQCLLQLNPQAKTPIHIPFFEGTLPQAVFVRGISGGTLQQVITRLNILHMLQQLGVLVYNAPRAIERTVDKAMTSFLLQQHQVATPATWVCESRQSIENVRTQFPHQTFVLKPLFGSQGVGVRLITPDTPLPVPMMQHVDGVYYMQAFVACDNTNQSPHKVAAKFSHDFRVFVIRDQVVATMRRTGQDWINNVAAGAQCEAFDAPIALVNIALAAAKAVDIDYCGVDVIQAENGEYYVLEVNSIPAWRGLQSVSDVNIADVLVKDFLHRAAMLKPSI